MTQTTSQPDRPAEEKEKGAQTMQSVFGRHIARGQRWIAAGALATVALVVALTVGSSGTAAVHGRSAAHPRGHVLSSTCGGPTGTAFVADAGYDAFSQINTANCAVVQNGGYNVGDPQVPGDPGDYNYSSTDEGVIATGGNLWFADTGSSNVAIINIASLNPSDYNPNETLVNTGFNPEALAATPDGSEVWVTDTGPQTNASSPSDVDVISTTTDTVTSVIPLSGAPSNIAFSPNGDYAYVTTSTGLAVFDVASKSLITEIGGLDDPHGVAVSPDGSLVYVTEAGNDTVAVIDAATNSVSQTIGVGSLPWQVLFAPNGATAYVADPDSNQVSVIDVATSAVSATISVPDDPDALALTTDASELWVGENSGGAIGVIDTGTDTLEASIALGTAYEPTGIVIVG
jgi:YVTN family beta-propeller protein